MRCAEFVRGAAHKHHLVQIKSEVYGFSAPPHLCGYAFVGVVANMAVCSGRDPWREWQCNALGGEIEFR